MAEGLLQRDTIRFLLFMSLTDAELQEQARAILVFPGSRPGNIPPEEIVEALTEEFFKDRAVAAALSTALDRKLAQPDLSFLNSKKDFREFKRRLSKSGPKDLCPFLWHLPKDGRPEARRAYEATCAALDEGVGALEGEIDEEAFRHLSERAKLADSLQTQVDEAKKSQKTQEKRLAELGRELEDARKLRRQAEAEALRDKEALKQAESRLRQKDQALDQARGLEGLVGEVAQARKRVEELELHLRAAEDKLRRQGRLKRVGLFVDVQNLVISGKELHGAGLDFEALYRKVEEDGGAGDRLIVEAVAYLAEDPIHEKLGLKRAIAQAGFQVRTRPVIFRADGTSKGDWDLGMAVEILERADRLDVAVLGTGDSDFEDLVRFLKEKKPHLAVEIVCHDSPRYTSERLLKAADRVMRLGPKQMMKVPAAHKPAAAPAAPQHPR